MNIRKALIPAAIFSVLLIVPTGAGKAQSGANSALAGNWQGTMTAGPTKLRITLKLQQDPAGKLQRLLTCRSKAHQPAVEHLLSISSKL